MARHPSTTGAACVIAASCCLQSSLFVAVIVMAASCLFGAAGVSGGPSSVKGTRGSRAIQVDAHASIQYSSVAALFPDVRGLTKAPTRAASSAATRPASTNAVKVDGGTIEYFHEADILASRPQPMAASVSLVESPLRCGRRTHRRQQACRRHTGAQVTWRWRVPGWLLMRWCAPRSTTLGLRGCGRPGRARAAQTGASEGGAPRRRPSGGVRGRPTG